MSVPTPSPVDLTLARWAKRTLTYGALVTAVVSAGLFFLFQTANKAALAPYGLDPAGFSGSVAETIGGGLASLLIVTIIVVLLYIPFGKLIALIVNLISWLYQKFAGVPKWLTKLDLWIASDPAKKTERALATGAAAIVPLICMVLLYIGTTIGAWRANQAEWLVATTNCASGCFSYTVEGRPKPIVGRPIAANNTRMAIVVGSNKAEIIDVAKVTSSEVYRGKPIAVPAEAPWLLKAQWLFLKLIAGDW